MRNPPLPLAVEPHQGLVRTDSRGLAERGEFAQVDFVGILDCADGLSGRDGMRVRLAVAYLNAYYANQCAL